MGHKNHSFVELLEANMITVAIVNLYIFWCFEPSKRQHVSACLCEAIWGPKRASTVDLSLPVPVKMLGCTSYVTIINNRINNYDNG